MVQSRVGIKPYSKSIKLSNIEQINKDWDFTIGLEIHVQLETNSKMFSSCEYSYDKSPNSLTCPTSLGLHELYQLSIKKRLILQLNLD